MPQIPIAIAKFLIFDVGLSVGTASATAALITNVALTAALSAATAALTRVPTPEAGKSTIKQERPPRSFGTGKCRVSGPFMLREVTGEHLTRVIALPEGPADHFGQAWLNDDAVIVIAGVVQGMADQRYPTGKVLLQTRLGEDTETNYAQATSDFPSLWPSSARGDGIPSMMLRCTNGDRDKFQRDYPNGEPDPSIEAFYRAYDWRDPDQNRDDNTTWTYSANAVVGLVNALWRRYGADWDECFAPSLALLTAEADVCDEAVDLKGGGTEPRYECGFFFNSTNSAADVMATYLASMDGWFAQRSDGAYVIRAGHYTEPTCTFGDREIIDYEFNPGPTPDAARNYLVVSFTDPANAYSKVETTPWLDSVDIAQRGEELNQDFYPQAVQSNGQARRLGKRALARGLSAGGTFRTPLSARRALGERYVGLNISESDDLNGVVVEIGEVSIDLSTSTIVWTYQLADPNIDAWNPDTEEGDGPTPTERPTPEALDPPDIDTVTAFFEDNGTGGSGVRLDIDAAGPDRADLIWYARWRVSGATAWVEAAFTDLDPGPAAELQTGFVTANATLEVQVAYRTGSGTLSDWGPASPASLSTTVDPVAPDPPTLLVDLGGDVGAAHIQWRNPVSANFNAWRVYRGTTNVFGAAAAIGSDTPGALGATVNFDNTSLGAGTYYFWVVAKNASGTASAPAGPLTVTVT